MRIFLLSLNSSVVLIACADGGARFTWMAGGDSLHQRV